MTPTPFRRFSSPTAHGLGAEAIAWALHALADPHVDAGSRPAFEVALWLLVVYGGCCLLRAIIGLLPGAAHDLKRAAEEWKRDGHRDCVGEAAFTGPPAAPASPAPGPPR